MLAPDWTIIQVGYALVSQYFVGVGVSVTSAVDWVQVSLSNPILEAVI